MVDHGLAWELHPRGRPQGVGGSLQFVQEVVQGWDAFLQTFAPARLGHHLAGSGAILEGVSGQDLPVVKHTLREGLATCVGPQVSGEACREGHGHSAHTRSPSPDKLDRACRSTR